VKIFISNISPNTEFILVIAIAFGYSIFESISRITFTHTSIYSIDNSKALVIIWLNLVALAILYYVLKLRGWKITDFNFSLSRYTLSQGILLLIAYYGLFLFIFAIFKTWFDSDTITSVRFVANISLPLIIIFSIVNSIYEEVIVVGYVVKRLEKENSLFYVISISSAIRLTYHLYQGPMAAISILPLGLLFAYFYCRWKSITPLIISHSILDIIGLNANQ